MKEDFESRCFREVSGRLLGCGGIELRGEGSVRLALAYGRDFPICVWRSVHDFLFGGRDMVSVFEFISDGIKYRDEDLASEYLDFARRNAWAAPFAGCASPEELILKMRVMA